MMQPLFSRVFGCGSAVEDPEEVFTKAIRGRSIQGTPGNRGIPLSRSPPQEDHMDRHTHTHNPSSTHTHTHTHTHPQEPTRGSSRSSQIDGTSQVPYTHQTSEITRINHPQAAQEFVQQEIYPNEYHPSQYQTHQHHLRQKQYYDAELYQHQQQHQATHYGYRGRPQPEFDVRGYGYPEMHVEPNYYQARHCNNIQSQMHMQSMPQMQQQQQHQQMYQDVQSQMHMQSPPPMQQQQQPMYQDVPSHLHTQCPPLIPVHQQHPVYQGVPSRLNAQFPPPVPMQQQQQPTYQDIATQSVPVVPDFRPAVSERSAKWKEMKVVEVSIVNSIPELGTPLVPKDDVTSNDENKCDRNEPTLKKTPLRGNRNDKYQQGVDDTSVAFGRIIIQTVQGNNHYTIGDDTPRPEARSPVSQMPPVTGTFKDRERGSILQASAPRPTRGSKFTEGKFTAASRKQSEPPRIPPRPSNHSSTDSSSGVESEPFLGVRRMTAMWERKTERSLESPKLPQTPTKVNLTLF